MSWLLTYSMDQSSSSEANRLSVSKEKIRILWKPEGSLPHSQVPTTIPVLSHIDPVQASIPFPEHPSYYYSPIFAWAFQVDLLFQISPPKPVCTFLLPHTYYKPRPSKSSRFYRPKIIWRGVQIKIINPLLSRPF